MAKAPPLASYKLLNRRDQTQDVFELTFANPQTDFKAGQFISIVIPGAGPGGRNLRRAYSIASPPQQRETFQLSIKLVEGGPGTTYLNSLKVGDEIQGQFPMGDFVLGHDLDAPVLFVGTGTGIAPHRSMVLSHEYDWSQHRGPVGFLLGVRCEDDILYPELFGPQRPAILHSSQRLVGKDHVKIALSRPKDGAAWKAQPHGFVGRVTDYLRGMENWDFSKTHVYLCGSGAMIQEVEQWLQEKGAAKSQIHKEAYFK